jgi:hypothetical protein
MSRSTRNPSWALLYALLPLLGGMFFLEGRFALPAWGHRVAQVGIVVFIYGLVERWIHRNQAALAWREVKDRDVKQPTMIYVWEPWSPTENEPGVSSTSELSAPGPREYPAAALTLPDESYQVRHLSVSPDNVAITSGKEGNA